MGHVLGAGLGALVRAFYWRLCLFTIFMMTTYHMESLFVAEKQVVRQATYSTITASLQAILVIVVSWTMRDVNMIIWALAWFALAKFLFASGYTLSVYRPSLRLVSLHTLKDQLSYALPVGLAGVTLVLVAQTDKFIINRFLGREAFAVYAVGAYQVPFVDMIRGSVINVTFPLMAQYQKSGDYTAILDLWRRSLLKVAVLFFPLFVFLEVAARPFITILFTNEYAGAIPIFMIYLLLFLRSSVETGVIVQVFKKTTYIAKVFSAGFVVNLVLSLILFEVMGRVGVPLATVITMYAVNAFNLWYAARLLGVTLRQLFPTLAVVKRLLVAVLVGVPLYFVQRAIDVNHIFELAVLGLGYFAVYFLISSLSGFISVDDIKAIFGRRSI